MTTTDPVPAVPEFALDRKEPQWCANCGGVQIFIPCIYLEDGRLGVCWGCDKEVFVPFTRTAAAEAA